MFRPENHLKSSLHGENCLGTREDAERLKTSLLVLGDRDVSDELAYAMLMAARADHRKCLRVLLAHFKRGVAKKDLLEQLIMTLTESSSVRSFKFGMQLIDELETKRKLNCLHVITNTLIVTDQWQKLSYVLQWLKNSDVSVPSLIELSLAWTRPSVLQELLNQNFGAPEASPLILSWAHQLGPDTDLEACVPSMLNEFGKTLWTAGEDGMTALQILQSPLLADGRVPQGHREHLASVLNHEMCTPRSLQSESRLAVRHALGEGGKSELEQLPLPKSLLDYLAFKEFHLSQDAYSGSSSSEE